MTARVRYFAYGSNLHPRRLARRAPTCSVITTGYLPGYRLAFHKRSHIDGSGKCNIVTTGNDGDRVFGAIYELSLAELVRLDDEEVVHGGYTRIDVQIVTGSGVLAPVGVYQAPQSMIDETLLPFDWYHSLVVHGARHHGLPAEYIGALEAIAARRDDDRERRRPFDQLLAQRD